MGQSPFNEKFKKDKRVFVFVLGKECTISDE
jgi:hypothetical protein